MKTQSTNAIAITLSVLITFVFLLFFDTSFTKFFYLAFGGQALLGLSLYLVLGDKEASPVGR